MTALDIFTYSGQQVRTVIVDGEPWFVASDVAGVLEYVNRSAAIAAHCKGVANHYPLKTLGGVQQVRLISEADTLRLILNSKLPSAERFERWVFETVLPSIRKTGSFSTAPALTEDETILRALTILTGRTAELEAKVAADAPKVLFADSVAASKTTILVGELAKILRGNGAELGQNRLFELLREDGYLIKRRGSDRNMPTQYSMELGLFEIKETAVTHSDGHVTVSKTPKVTGKGQAYFVNRYAPSTGLAVAS